MRLKISRTIIAGFICLGLESTLAQSAAPAATNGLPAVVVENLTSNSIVLPSGINDPIEPFNRGVWAFNTGLLEYAVRPVEKVYRGVVVKPVRQGIGRMGKNLTYPDRLANNLLQGNWMGMYHETERCLCNTVIGVGGFFDVATRWGIPASDLDCGNTFKKWGWNPSFYLMLPLLGPSDDRDATGLGGDALANPMTYFFPYDLISSGVSVNNFSDTVEGALRFTKSEADSYSILQYGWSFTHANRPVDMRVIGEKDEPTLQTLQVFFFSYQDPEFPAEGETRSVLIPATGRKLNFSTWLQPQPAPLVYIIPGLGTHRLSGNVLGLAELLYKHGYSTVCVSSTFQPEFMEEASTSDLPAFPPADINDLHVALTEIDHQLAGLYPGRFGSRALMGYSMGAFQTLFLAATTATNQAPLVKFDRYVAIDTPVRLRYGVTNLDQFYQAALAWPAAERTADIENTLMKVAALAQQPPTNPAALPFSAVESKFLIGLSFRLSLRDIIFSSQSRHNQGVLKLPLNQSRRRAVYDEIMQYSFKDYIEKFATPYDLAHGIDMKNPQVESDATNLRDHTAELQTNQDIRVIENRNDFLLANHDLAWIQSTFAPAQVRIFDQGGHLGNLAHPEVQQAILNALGGLSSISPDLAEANQKPIVKFKNQNVPQKPYRGW